MDTSLTYRFYVTGVNFNGEGAASGIAYLNLCTMPSNLKTPTITGVTSTTISIAWSSPASNGGCLVQGYNLYVDDGSNGPFTLRYELTQPFTTA